MNNMEEPRQTYQRLGPGLVRRRGYHFPVHAWTHAHWCPACQQLHDFAVEQPFTNRAQWTFDGNGNLPTMSPSMNIRIGPYPSDAGEPGRMDVCHYFLTHGRLLFLGDCTHALMGQTVDLPAIPAEALRLATEVLHE